jgi:TMEM175 potassium channel family protein
VEARGAQRRHRWHRDEREVEFSRIVAFSDGVFAIAITLLVLNLHVPGHLHGDQVFDSLRDQDSSLLAYALSFAVIGRLWMVHHRFFGEVTHFDDRLLSFNLAYLAFVVLIPFTTEILGDYDNTTAGVIIYAANLVLVSVVGTAMFVYAGRSGMTVGEFRRAIGRPLRMRSFSVGAVFALSIPVALVSPTLAKLMWLVGIFLPGERSEEPEGEA